MKIKDDLLEELKTAMFTSDVAEALKVSRATVLLWIDSGKLESIKFSGKHYIPYRSFRALIESEDKDI